MADKDDGITPKQRQFIDSLCEKESLSAERWLKENSKRVLKREVQIIYKLSKREASQVISYLLEVQKDRAEE